MVAASVLALLAAAGYVTLLYVFFTRIWPLLPVWANILIVIASALSFIASPLMLLLRLERMPQRRE